MNRLELHRDRLPPLALFVEVRFRDLAAEGPLRVVLFQRTDLLLRFVELRV